MMPMYEYVHSGKQPSLARQSSAVKAQDAEIIFHLSDDQ